MNLRNILLFGCVATIGIAQATPFAFEEVSFSTLVKKKPYASFTFFKKALAAAPGIRAKAEVLRAMVWMARHMNFGLTGRNPLIFKDAKGNTLKATTFSQQFAVAATQYPALLKILLELRDIHADLFEFDADAKVDYLQRARKDYSIKVQCKDPAALLAIKKALEKQDFAAAQKLCEHVIITESITPELKAYLFEEWLNINWANFPQELRNHFYRILYPESVLLEIA